MTEESCTWCYITKFLCRYDSLSEAKKRYQERVDVVREKYEVVLASEQAYSMGHSQPMKLIQLLGKHGSAGGW